MTVKLRHSRTRIALGCLICATFASCGGESSLSVSKPAAQRPDVDAGMIAKGVVEIPGAAEFNYTTYRSGQTGEARGEVKQVGKDGAVCSVQAGADGSGWAECLLGYCFDNTSGSILNAAVHLKLRVAQQVEGVVIQPQTIDNATSAKGTLQFLIKDTNGKTLRTENLMTGDLATGSGSASATHDLVFATTFEPGKGYYIVLAGRVDVAAGKEQNSKMTLEIADASMNISWKAAAPAQADASKNVPDSAQ